MVFLILAASSMAQQFQPEGFDEFGQFIEPQTQFQPSQHQFQQPQKKFRQSQQQFQQPQQQFQQPQLKFQQPQQQFQQPQQQFQQPQQQFQQPQQKFQQPQRVGPTIRRPQSHKFVDPQSVTITPSSSQGIQHPQARFPVSQQFVQPAPAVAAARGPVRQYHYVEGDQSPPVQEAFQQQPPQPQTFEPAPAPAPAPVPPPAHAPVPLVSVRTQTRQKLQPVVVSADPSFDEIARHQAETAKYAFKSAVTDTLSDTQHVREEVRDGLALQGVYSYSDGYFKRTVHYEADENGYRVVKEDVEPIGDGPQEDPNGSAEVKSNVGGTNLQYTITAADINPRLRQPQPLQQGFLSQR